MAVKDLNMIELKDGDFVDKTPVVPERSVESIALEINVIKERAARDLLAAAVDVGRLLCEAKEKVPYGEWGEWLEQNVSYSVSNANNMMRLYQEQQSMAQLDMFGNNDFSVFEGMSPSQVLALLPVPREERAKFIEETGAKEMSVREIREAVKGREEAEKRAEEAEARAKAAEERAGKAEQDTEEISARLESAETQIRLMESMPASVSEEELKRIEKEAAEKAKADADKKIEAAKKKAEKELEKARAEGAEAVKKVEAEREAAIKSAKEQARADAEKETAAKIAEMERELAAARVNASPYLTRFKERMEVFQQAYAAMVAVVEDAEQNEPETGAQLNAALEQIASALVGG